MTISLCKAGGKKIQSYQVPHDDTFSRHRTYSERKRSGNFDVVSVCVHAYLTLTWEGCEQCVHHSQPRNHDTPHSLMTGGHPGGRGHIGPPWSSSWWETDTPHSPLGNGAPTLHLCGANACTQKKKQQEATWIHSRWSVIFSLLGPSFTSNSSSPFRSLETWNKYSTKSSENVLGLFSFFLLLASKPSSPFDMVPH